MGCLLLQRNVPVLIRKNSEAAMVSLLEPQGTLGQILEDAVDTDHRHQRLGGERDHGLAEPPLTPTKATLIHCFT